MKIVLEPRKRKPIRFMIFIMTLLPILISACGRLTHRLEVSQVTQNPAPEAVPTPVKILQNGPIGDSVGTIKSGGEVRSYRLHVPPGYQPGQPIAIVFNLHGLGESPELQEKLSQMDTKADAANFIVIYPQGTGSPLSWKFGPLEGGQNEVQFFRDMIGQLESQYSLDPRRIYVTGISNGAEMAYRLGCVMGDTFAAVAMVSGGYPPFKDCESSRPVPALAFHGTADKLLGYAGHPPLFLGVHDWAASWASRNGCSLSPAIAFQKDEVTAETWSNCQAGADVTLYTITGKGHSWPGSVMPANITTKVIDATALIWDFFAAHPKP